MSLINRMLEDLDARNAQGAANGRARLSRRGGSIRLPWIIAAVSLALAGVMAAAWFMQYTPAADVAAKLAGTSTAEQDASGSTNGTGNAAQPGNESLPVEEPTAVESELSEENSVAETTTASTEAEPATSVTASKPSAAGIPTEASGSAVTEKKTDTPARSETLAGESRSSDESGNEPDDDNGELQVSRHLPEPEEAAREQINEGLRAMRAQYFEIASTRLAAGLEVLPGEDQAREALYVAYRRQGRIAEAEGVLRDGLALADEPPRFAKLLARELAARDSRSEALKVLAIEIPPVTRDPEYHALRGALLQQEARYAEALPVYAGLVRHYQDNGTWLAGLGMAQEQTGNIDDARRNYARALQAGGLAATVKQYVQGRLAALEAAAESGE